MKILIQEDLDPAFPANLKAYISNKLPGDSSTSGLWPITLGSKLQSRDAEYGREKMWGNILTGLFSFSRKNLVCLFPPPKISAEESHEY